MLETQDICGRPLKEQPKPLQLHNMRRELPFRAAPFLVKIFEDFFEFWNKMRFEMHL